MSNESTVSWEPGSFLTCTCLEILSSNKIVALSERVTISKRNRFEYKQKTEVTSTLHELTLILLAKSPIGAELLQLFLVSQGQVEEAEDVRVVTEWNYSRPLYLKLIKLAQLTTLGKCLAFVRRLYQVEKALGNTMHQYIKMSYDKLSVSTPVLYDLIRVAHYHKTCNRSIFHQLNQISYHFYKSRPTVWPSLELNTMLPGLNLPEFIYRLPAASYHKISSRVCSARYLTINRYNNVLQYLIDNLGGNKSQYYHLTVRMSSWNSVLGNLFCYGIIKDF